MKNIHVLPTDKPSRLLVNKENTLVLTSNYYSSSNPQHIYITSDEEIKDGYYLDLTHNIIMKSVFYPSSDKNCKKIILTDNEDLIKDGVQAIDDDFLEWFVKNPSCERVEVEKIMECEKCGKEHCDNLQCRGYKDIPYYKIIIPKEEPKQETLEEAIKKEYKFGISSHPFPNPVDIGGQEEKIYSEEEVLELLDKREDYVNSEDNIFEYQNIKQWFEKFKKK